MSDLTSKNLVRDTARTPLFFGLNIHMTYSAFAAFLIPYAPLQKLLFVIAILSIIALNIAARFGITPKRAAKALRTKLSKRTRMAWCPTLNRGVCDFRPLPFNFKYKLFTVLFFGLFCFLTPVAPAGAGFRYIAPDLKANASIMSIEGEALNVAVGKIIPDGFDVSFAKDVDRFKKIQWETDKTWEAALKDALKPAKLQFQRRNTQVYIFPDAPKEKKPLKWVGKKEELLSAVLRRWGKASGVSVEFITDRDWILSTAISFNGTFEQAVHDLLAGLQTSTPAPIAELVSKRTRLNVFSQEAPVS